MKNLMAWLTSRGLLAQEEGQSLVEYALILALIAFIAIGAFVLLGSQISDTWRTPLT